MRKVMKYSNVVINLIGREWETRLGCRACWTFSYNLCFIPASSYLKLFVSIVALYFECAIA